MKKHFQGMKRSPNQTTAQVGFRIATGLAGCVPSVLSSCDGSYSWAFLCFCHCFLFLSEEEGEEQKMIDKFVSNLQAFRVKRTVLGNGTPEKWDTRNFILIWN